MDVQQHQELEMIEVPSDVYDINYPTPVSLKKLSAIAVGLEIWRRKVNEYRTGGKLNEFDPRRLRKAKTWVKTMLPDLPSTIYKTIEQVVSRFGYSMDVWRTQHYERGFCFQYSDENHVLEDFDDFVCDYDGSIHYVRTAERMMRCERFDSKMKFTVACMYFFEDDIRRVWPSISKNMDLDLIDFDKCPLVYYWICRLTNKLDKIQTRGSETVDIIMFRMCMPYNKTSVEYFWNRIPLEDRMQHAVVFLDGYDFVRFILPKLDDEQLDEYVNDGSYGAGDDLYTMFLDLHCDEWIVLRTWLRIRNVITESNFADFIFRMVGIRDGDVDECYEQEKWEYLCCQIWNHTPLNLKRSVIELISSESDSSWFDFESIIIDDRINAELLFLILQDASSEERNSFWCDNWTYVIAAVRCKDLQRVIELCFENANEITEFKQNVMINSRDVLQVCVSLLQCADFEQRILQSAFLDVDCKLNRGIVSRIVDLNEFINDAFDNVDLSADFKNLALSSSSAMKGLSRTICSETSVSFETLVKFIYTLVSMEETLMQVKKSLIDSLKERLTTNNGYISLIKNRLFSNPEFNSILLWCLGSNEGVEEFKLNCAL